MTYFEPPPLPRSSGDRPAGPAEPADPYAADSSAVNPYAASPYATPPQATEPYGASPLTGPPGPAPAAPWGPPAQPTHPRGTVILVLGILSVTVLQLLGPVAWVMGHNALREIDAAGATYGNRSSVMAGMVLGIIGTVMGVAALVGMAFAVAILVQAV